MMTVVTIALLLVSSRMFAHDCNGHALMTSGSRVEDERVDGTAFNLCVYTVVTETGKKTGAGTDASISLRVMDKDGKEVYFPTLDNGNNNFERGSVDTFSLMGTCVPSFCKLILYTDYTGFFPSWFVESVSISVASHASNFEKTWQLHQWLPKEDDSTAPRFLVKDDC